MGTSAPVIIETWEEPKIIITVDVPPIKEPIREPETVISK